jgi:outer membrane protein
MTKIRNSELGIRNKSKTHGLCATGFAILIFIFSAAIVLADDVTATAQPAPAATAIPAAKPAVKKHAKAKPKKAVPAATAVPTAAPESVTQAAEPAAVTITAVASAAAAGAKVLTYDECYNIAAEKNRDYKIARLDKTMAEAELFKAAASFGPTLSLGAQYEPLNVTAPEIIPPGSAMYDAFYQLYKLAGVTPTAGSPISLSLYQPSYYAARITLTQPLFTFGKTFFGFKIADEAYRIAQIKFKQAGDKLKLDVISAFYGALIAQELSDTLQEALKANEEYLRITKTKYENGQASNFDVLQAQVQYANSVPDAKRAADGAMLAAQALKNTLGLPLEDQISLSGTTEYKKFEMAYEDIKKKFQDRNDSRDMIEAAANMAKYGKNLQAAMFLPNIGLTANYNYTSSDPAFHHEAWDWQSSWDVSVGMQWTFFDSFKNVASMKEAAANDEKAELNKENMNDMLKIQLDQLYTSMEESSQVIEAAGDLIKQAQEGYRIAKESYKNGLIQSVDLLQAETGLLRAKMNYLNAMFNYLTTAQKLRNFVD